MKHLCGGSDPSARTTPHGPSRFAGSFMARGGGLTRWMVGWGGQGSARFRCDRHTSAYGQLGRPRFGDDSAVGLRGYPEGNVSEDGAGPVARIVHGRRTGAVQSLEFSVRFAPGARRNSRAISSTTGVKMAGKARLWAVTGLGGEQSGLGGPRLGARAGTRSGSPSAFRNLVTL